MSAKSFDAKVASYMSGLILLILGLIPFHAFLTVWLASLLGHYTLLRLWKEMLLVIMLCGALFFVYRDTKLRWKLISYKLHWLLLAYVVVQLVWGVVALLSHTVTAKAVGYAWIINLRFLAFFWLAWVAANYVPRLQRAWPRLIVWPLLVVVVFGLLQYFVLPYDALKHIGYNNATIFPYETINHNIHHLRIMSTLRGANPLGAYLVLVVSLIIVRAYKKRSSWLGLLLLGSLAVLFLSFSRSAWIGLVLSGGVLGWSLLKTPRARQWAVSMSLGLLVIASVTAAMLWHNTNFQDTVLHTDDKSTAIASSNQGHQTALRNGVMDLLHQPFGRGPGTAGPASIYNNHPPRIAENYFVQIGQETGWIGLLLFVAINLVVGRALWRRRDQSLALGLFAALVGLTFVNLLSHAWADDTLAYLWWGLAGIAIATDLGSKDDGRTPKRVDI